MRHLNRHRKLSRTSEHRLSLRRSLAQSLFEHGEIVTTLAKAKDARPYIERLITMAKKAHAGDLAARQRLTQAMNDRAIIPADHQEDYDMMSDARRQKTKQARSGRRHRTGDAKAGLKFTAESVVHRLVNTVAPRYLDRPGGYTRVIRLARTRIGDNSDRAVLQLVGEEEKPGPVSKPKKTAREKRVERRYAAAARAAKGATKRSAASTPRAPAARDVVQKAPAEPESESPPEPETEARSPESAEPRPDTGDDQAPRED